MNVMSMRTCFRIGSVNSFYNRIPVSRVISIYNRLNIVFINLS